MAFIFYECGTQGKFVDFVSLSLLSKLFIVLVVKPRKLPLSFAVGNSRESSSWRGLVNSRPTGVNGVKCGYRKKLVHVLSL